LGVDPTALLDLCPAALLFRRPFLFCSLHPAFRHSLQKVACWPSCRYRKTVPALRAISSCPVAAPSSPLLLFPHESIAREEIEGFFPSLVVRKFRPPQFRPPPKASNDHSFTRCLYHLTSETTRGRPLRSASYIGPFPHGATPGPIHRTPPYPLFPQLNNASLFHDSNPWCFYTRRALPPPSSPQWIFGPSAVLPRLRPMMPTSLKLLLIRFFLTLKVVTVRFLYLLGAP